MFASQLEPDQWYLRINSELCADSILNRAVEHARILDIKGPNMREYTADARYPIGGRAVPSPRRVGTAPEERRY